MKTTKPYVVKEEKFKDGSRLYTVQGSKKYKVYKSPQGIFRCKCDGYLFKGYCKHIEAVLLKDYEKQNKERTRNED